MQLLSELQELFVDLENQWVSWVLTQGWKLRHSEGRIFENGPDGKGRVFYTLGIRMRGRDGVHKKGGSHYNGIGSDWVLVVDGIILKNGDAPQWRKAGEFWESLHPLCRWGGRFGDANHISLEWRGIK